MKELFKGIAALVAPVVFAHFWIKPGDDPVELFVFAFWAGIFIGHFATKSSCDEDASRSRRAHEEEMRVIAARSPHA